MNDNYSAPTVSDLPLRGVRVIDMADGKAEMCGRYLADLGADVIMLEPIVGAASRRREPIVEGHSLYFATHNANKRSVIADLTSDSGRLLASDLISSADILIETMGFGGLAMSGLDIEAIRLENPALVVLSISDFGLTGPYRDFIATESVLVAMGGVLSRSGLPAPSTRPPLLPPGRMAEESSAIQAAWCALVAYWNRLRTGIGDHLDFSVFEATAQIIDPGLGVTGSAASGQSALESYRGRPDRRHYYPIFACADGWVRVCVLGVRQWRAMREWLGDPPDFLDDAYDKVGNRHGNVDRLHPLIDALFSGAKADELVEEGQRRGVPIAALRSAAEVLQEEHFLERGAFVDLEVEPGLVGRAPSGYTEVNGTRAGIRTPAPALGSTDANPHWLQSAFASPASPARPKSSAFRPLTGIRVLDLGVIVVGAEVGRLFSDQGAEVIKVESAAYPDGNRSSISGGLMSPSFASGHRGKLSLGLNLRDERGKQIFKQLVAVSDVVLSNFKPGTMESLGLGYDTLRQINPRIVMADSSAMGSTGAKSRRMGYGPLVRAETGLTRLWRYPDEDGSFSDAVTVFPDHFAARVEAVAVLAALIDRERTGRGGTISVSQAETILVALSDSFMRESIRPGTFVALGNASDLEAPSGVFRCAGDDEWVVISPRNGWDWLALCDAMNRPDLAGDPRFGTSQERLAHAALLEGHVHEWTSVRTPTAATAILQAVGVPAGPMLRVAEYLDDPQLRRRRFVRFLEQPGLPGLLPTENGPCLAITMPEPEMRAAPFPAEHTRPLAHRLLGLTDEQIDALISDGVLERSALEAAPMTAT